LAIVAMRVDENPVGGESLDRGADVPVSEHRGDADRTETAGSNILPDLLPLAY
jgi:hypothetical protein